MSTVAITDLVPGTAATSTAVNATLTSFVNGTAAGSLVAGNASLEGVDRRTMSGPGHVVFTTEMGTNTIVSSGIASANTRSTTPLYATVPTGTPLVTNVMTIAVTSRVLLSASVAFLGQTGADPLVRLLLELMLQVSVDNGVSWTDLEGTRQRFRMRNTITFSTPVQVAAINGNATWCVITLALGVPALYRVAFRTTDDAATVGGQDINFLGGTIFVEIFGA